MKITKAQAIERKLKTYYGEPCKRGHDGRRFTKGGKCVQCTLDVTRRIRETRKAKTGKTAKNRTVEVISPNKLYDGGEIGGGDLWHISRDIQYKLKQIDQSSDEVVRLLAKAKALCTDRGFTAFCEVVGLKRSRTYELLAVADGRKTIEEVRADATERQRRSREKRKAVRDVTDEPKVEITKPEPPVIEAEIIEVMPPTTAEPEQRDHLGRTWDEKRWIENHLMRSVLEIYVGGFIDRSPEELAAMIEASSLPQIEKVTAFLTKLAEAMRRKAARW